MERTSSDKHVLARHSSEESLDFAFFYGLLVRGEVVTQALLLVSLRRGVINIFPHWSVRPRFPRWHGAKSGAAKRDPTAALLSARIWPIMQSNGGPFGAKYPHPGHPECNLSLKWMHKHPHWPHPSPHRITYNCNHSYILSQKWLV